MISYKHIHFIGIGGIGMSALARMCLVHGVKVSGSDSAESAILEKLRHEGAEIHIGHQRENLSDSADCVVYTLAVDNLNAELEETRLRELPMFTYAQMLGEVSRNMYTVAIAGTHGKTTTTAMAADVFAANDRSPHVIVGSLLTKTNSNYIKGNQETFVVEACEYKRSFLNLNPNVLLITNLEEDHLDYYHGLADIQDAFRHLVHKVPADGFIICDAADEKVKPVLEGCVATIVDYKKHLAQVPELYVLGDHNVQNAGLILALAEVLKFDMQKTEDALAHFRGTWRRLEYKGEHGALKIYDDYAHHPTEIRAGIAAFRKRFPDMPLTVVFQPHLYSRTKEHFDEFVEVLSAADRVLLLPIYAAREPHDESVSSLMLKASLHTRGVNVEHVPDFESAVEYIRNVSDTPAIVVTTGAGDVYKIADSLLA